MTANDGLEFHLLWWTVNYQWINYRCMHPWWPS